jgi:membrane-bound serine protease (ClpP class)
MIRTRRTIRRWLPVVFILAAGSALLAQEPAQKQETEYSGEVLVASLSGDINTGSADYLMDAIDKAQTSERILVIELDTPGGMLNDTQDLVKKMLGSKVPLVVYVTPKGAQAASAGTFITMAAHVAIMAPGSRIGAAHPVMMPIIPGGGGGEDKDQDKQKQQDHMMEKVTNDTVSFVIAIAKQRGRNQEWAEKSVRESVSITSDVAVKDNVVDMEAEDLADLLEKIDGRQVKISEKTTVTLKTKGAAIVRLKMSLKQRLLNFLANPNILMILLALGGLGIMIEFYHPGSIFPGVVGAICLLLAFTSMQILPVNWGGLLLLLVGIGLFIAEVYVTSYGMLGLGGAVCFLVGGILLVDPSSEPHYLDPTLSVDWSVLIPLVVVMALICFLIGYYVIRSQRSKIETGVEGMEGTVGEARSDISAQEGKVFIRGEHWKAVSQESIPAGSKVEVVRVEGLLLHVKKKG